ncbi:MAG TPA: phenylalanine--tRNA ligase subunit beta [Bacillota bacterium]|nr:phenylalanine--tRNA ligase subunit beta [Bacillota bacterium]HOL08516.1 phenylalanine--tRNA ligase subunit beta [Bacillota bacterium]HPO97003.1 phenylalanine--tRNA ligase subunit beta [Bacillota bacterium]
MRVSFEWLKEYVDIPVSVTELAEKMTMAGIAVEEIEDQALQYQNMYVAKVLNIEKHQQADNLLIVKVDVGQLGQLQIITAAKNLQVGDLVPLAVSGAVLPDGKVIQEVNFKGVLSQGMFCSGEELGLEKKSTGIWIFDTDFQPGTPVAEALGATDQVLVLELTANRSDCLGMIGVAREVAAILGVEYQVQPNELQEAGPVVSGMAGVTIANPELCPRYAARVAVDIKIGPSPQWMQRRLQAAGVRPINNIVDITNYVMLEYNQPLHAFDLDRIKQHQIIVRRAESGEKLTTLDEVERELSGENLVIADPGGALCVAGVMGGASSEVTEQTKNILLEAAYFDPLSIRKTAKFLEMRTESSLRFERGIDPNGTLEALNRAAYLIEKIGAGKVAQGYIDQYPQVIPEPTIKTAAQRINGLLGTDLASTTITEYLKRLGLKVELGEADQLTVTVPTFRRDISHMADLAEEVARLNGYDKIPVTFSASKSIGERTPFQKLQYNLRRFLQGQGLSEIWTSSLYATDAASKLGLPETDPRQQTVALLVPLNENQAVMRTTLVSGMLEAMAFNNRRRQNDLAFYELGRVYLPKAGAELPDEPLHLAVGLMGRREEQNWNQPAAEYDFYDLKGILESIFEKFRLPLFTLERSTLPFYHPGQSADIYVNGVKVGHFGRIHPEIIKRYELNNNAYLMELNLSQLNELPISNIRFKPLPKFPAVQRDLALVIAEEITAESVINQIKEFGGELVEEVKLFDVYQGEQVAPGQRSLAFSITYRSNERTLKDQEIIDLQAEILAKLNAKYGAIVRG